MTLSSQIVPYVGSNHEIVPYLEPTERSENEGEIPATSVGLIYSNDPCGTASEGVGPPVEQIHRLKKWRKRRTVVAGVSIGVVMLALLGPVGGIAGGVAGGIAVAYATRKALKRREKKVIEKLMALQYPLIYNRNAVFA